MNSSLIPDESYNDFMKENKIVFMKALLETLGKFLHDKDIASMSYVTLIDTIIKLAPNFAPNERFIFQWIDDKETKK